MTTTGQARLDAELVRRGLARSRRRAAELIADGRVRVGGSPAAKASQVVGEADRLDVDHVHEYVSRAAHKLDGALEEIEALVPGAVRVRGAACLDAGASTGGFTQVLLERGARHVLAVDVGHGQLAAPVREDPRVTVREGLNVRDLRPADVGEAPGVVVADLSFISLTMTAPVLLDVAAGGADLLLMVKPQFEVGRERVSGGVVTSPALRAEAVVGVARACRRSGGRIHAVVPSSLPGEQGNVEYFLWVGKNGQGAEDRDAMDRGAEDQDVHAAVRAAVQDHRPVLVGGAA